VIQFSDLYKSEKKNMADGTCGGNENCIQNITWMVSRKELIWKMEDVRAVIILK
jgi:hypothetical protein